MLSSDILEQQFGPTEIVIIFQDENHRLIQTTAKNGAVVLELSLVTFDRSNVQVFSDVHHKILDGSSMGKAFRDADINFTRRINFIDHREVPADIQTRFSTRGQATIVDVDIFVGPDNIHYCHITEIYSPIVSWPDLAQTESPNIEQTFAAFSRLLNRA